MDLRPTNNNNRNNIDNELRAYEKFEADVKNTIFGVLFVLLKEQEISIYSSVILAVIQFLQLMIFPFHKTIYGIWNSPDVTDVLETMFNYLNIVPYFDGSNFDLYITFLYIAILIVAISLVIVFYVSYAFTKKKLSFTWPIVALRYLFIAFVSIFFLPFLDYFVSVFACVDDSNGVKSHSYFTEVKCWRGSHILHATFAIIITIIFLALCIVISLTYFEYKDASNDPTARVNSRANVMVIVYEAIMILCLTFLTDHKFQIVLIAILLLGSLILFLKFYLGSPYRNEIMSKLWATLTAINLWTAVMLVFAKIMEDSLFEGTIIAWLLGIPFVILIVLTIRDHRVDLLLINVNKFQNGQEIQDQIRYILKLIEWQGNNRNSAILLDGYIEIHKQSCNKDDCPLKQKVVKNNRFTKNLMSQDETLNEKYALLIQLLYQMYSYGIKKFPNNTSLRIAYAFFLLEKMQSKQQALQELTQAEQNKPPFDEQFIIFRYKRIIEDEIAESQQEGQGLDVISEAAFQTYLRQLQASIEKSALLHMEFWSQLSEDNPDLAKLNDVGSKINTSVHTVEEFWTKLIKTNANNAKAMRLYGKYLIEIINDKEAGEELLEKARSISNVQSNKRVPQILGAGGDDSSNDATPTLWVSGEPDKFGLISGINLAAANLFGYNKTELLNRKVNALMPQIYGKHHDSFMENYLNTGEGTVIGKNKERLVFGKNKSNYIFPIHISLRAVQSIIQGIQFIATFRVEKNFKNAAYILAQPDGTIDAMSSSAISLLKIDLKVVSQKKANLQDFIPNIVKDRYSLFGSTNNAGKASTTINFTYPKDSEYLLENEESTCQLQCFLNDIVFLGGRENAGFQFRFERIPDKTISVAQADRRAKLSNFQFKFDKNKIRMVGEYAQNSTSEIQSGPVDDLLGGIQNTDQNLDSRKDAFSSAKKSQQDELVQVEAPKIDYSLGIKTLRLMDGRPQEVDDDKGEEEDEEAEYERNSSQNNQNQQLQQEDDREEDGSYRDFSTTFKSRKALTSVVNDKTPPSSIKNLRHTANFLGIVLIVIALLDYIFAINEFDNINNDIELLDKSNIRLAEMMTALSRVRDLGLLSVRLFRNPNNETLFQDIYNEATLKAELKASLDNAKRLKEELEQETSSLSNNHLNLLNIPSIKLVNLNSGNTTKGLTQATEEVISRAFDLAQRGIADINPSNSDYYYVTYNLLNGFYMGLRSSSQFYAMELDERVNEKGSSFLILLVASIAAIALSMMILFPILYQVNKTREEVLSLFLDIPEKTVKGLYNKCETFISNLQVGDDEDMVSEIDEEDIDKHQGEQETQDFIPRRRRKRFKNSGRNQRAFFIKFAAVGVIMEAYFIYTFISANLMLEDISTVIPELNATSVAEPSLSFANNAERQLFLDPSMKVLNGDVEIVVTNNIKVMYDLDSLILEAHSTNRKIHSKDYIDIFNKLMMSNPCPEFTSAVDDATCTAFADQTVHQGMTVALARHFENLRILLSCYSKLANDANCTISPINATTLAGYNTQYNSYMNLIRTTQAVEMGKMQDIYIKTTFRLLMTNFKQSLKDSFDDALTIRLIVFIIFIFLILCIYIFLWQPLVRKLSNDIWRTKSMLNMIPLSVIAKIKSIRLYLKEFWNERNLQE